MWFLLPGITPFDGRSHSLPGYEGHTRHRLKVRFDTTARQLCCLDLLNELGQQ